MARNSLRGITAMAGLTALAWVAYAQTPPPTPPAPPPAIATVGARRVTRAEFEQRAAQAMTEYRARTGSSVPAELEPAVRRQLLETLIRRELLMLEVERRGLLGTEKEAEDQLKRDPFFQLNGTFNEAKFLAIKATSPGAYQAALREVRLTLGARRLSQKLEADYRPSEDAIRAQATQALGSAAIDYLALRRSDFAGTYPEPREEEILAAYRARQAEFQRPDRAELTVAFIDQPSLPESLAGDASAKRAWSERMRHSADSALAAVRAGATLEAATAAFGVPRSRVVVLPNNLPGFWAGTARDAAALFAATAGTMHPQPVPATSGGWLLVRVDDVRPAYVAPLREVSPGLRAQLRAERRRAYDDQVLRALYDATRDSLVSTAVRVRYAIVDTGAVRVPEPSAAELDRYYRAHLADYTVFDSRTGGVLEKPLAEVRDDVRSRWRAERREALGRTSADRLREAWSHGRRDGALERAFGMREAGPTPIGAAVDSTEAGRVIGDSLQARGGALGVGAVATSRGVAVFHAYQTVPRHVPTFEQARFALAERREREQAARDESAARAAFEAAPQDFVGDDIVHFSRLVVPRQPALSVPLTRRDVERYHREHLDEFSAPEMVRVSHILVSPRDASAAADAQALAKARVLLDRIKAGEDFAGLAREHSDDPATRPSGGDLGQVRRGALLDAVEQAAFALRAGELSDIVKSEAGYHILKVTEYLPRVAQPLDQIYTNVGMRLANERSDTLAMLRADSLARFIRTPAQARAIARRAGLPVQSFDHPRGGRAGSADLVPYFRAIERTTPGTMVPGAQRIIGLGWVITWVDSVRRPERPTWEQAREGAIARQRREAGQRALDAKRAELDAMLAAGWTLDSLGALYGGLGHAQNLVRGGGVPGIIRGDRLDSLIFGAGNRAPLAPAATSPWVALAEGAIRIRLADRATPAGTQVGAEARRLGQIELERKLEVYYAGLRKRFPVRILDARLSAVELPPLPPPGSAP